MRLPECELILLKQKQEKSNVFTKVEIWVDLTRAGGSPYSNWYAPMPLDSLIRGFVFLHTQSPLVIFFKSNFTKVYLPGKGIC